MEFDEAREEIVVNFYRVRRALGFLGLSLPLLLLLAGWPLGAMEPAISDYYHTLLRDIFVAVMSTIGVFLICYTGYRPEPDLRLSDDVVTTVAGVAALMVVFLPNQGTMITSLEPRALGQHVVGVRASDMLHNLAATTFLLCMPFSGGAGGARTASPGRRWIFRACAAVIVAATVAVIAAACVRRLGSPDQAAFVIEHQLIFWFQALGVWAFSVGWLVKGRVDRDVLGLRRRGRRSGRQGRSRGAGRARHG